MAWENLDEDIAEEFSDNRQLGWVDSGFSFIRRKGRGESCPKQAAAPLRGRRRRASDAAWRRQWRLRRRLLALLAGTIAHRCKGYGCFNLLAQLRGQGRRLFCSADCKVRVVNTEKRCAAPGCSRLFLGFKRQTTCSNACRQRAWYHRRGRTAGASGVSGAKDGGASGPQE